MAPSSPSRNFPDIALLSAAEKRRFEEEEEAEEEELLRRDPLLPVGTQRVCLIHPEVKRGPGKPQLTRGDPERHRGRGRGH